MVRIAIFASGSGSNAEQIINHLKGHDKIQVNAILTNRKDAFVIERAKRLQIKSYTFARHDFYNSNMVLELLKAEQTDWIILAGFLWLVPNNILEAFPKKVINIHPALLPKYGGKGMYGMKVHEAVHEAGELETGITIHYVNEKYDEGQIIFQKSVALTPSDTPESIAKKIHQLEYAYFPKVIEQEILK